MIHFQNSIIKLDYNPASDILTVAYFGLHDFLIAQIKNSVAILIATLTNYNVTKVLLDSCQTIFLVKEQASRAISVYLASCFIKTRNQTVARVQLNTTLVEATTQNNLPPIRHSLPLPF